MKPHAADELLTKHLNHLEQRAAAASRLTLHEYNIKTSNHEENIRLTTRPARLHCMFGLVISPASRWGRGCAQQILGRESPQGRLICINHMTHTSTSSRGEAAITPVET